jgi:hypothetical protein
MEGAAMTTDDIEMKTTYRVLAYARERFIDGFENLMDDPSFLHHPDEGDPQEYFAERRKLARDLGMDFDQMVRDHKNAIERDRLLRLMHATVA